MKPQYDSVIGIIEAVELVKTGTKKDGTTYKQGKVLINGEKYTTFDYDLYVNKQGMEGEWPMVIDDYGKKLLNPNKPVSPYGKKPTAQQARQATNADEQIIKLLTEIRDLLKQDGVAKVSDPF